MARSRAFALIAKELREVLPPTLFFIIGFNLIELTTQLTLDDYLVRFANFMVAVAAALVVGKAVLLANLLPLLGRFDGGPLIRPILFKTLVYTLVVMLVRTLEKIVEFFGWWAPRRDGGLCRQSLYLAPIRGNSDLGLRPFSHLHLGHRAERATRRG